MLSNKLLQITEGKSTPSILVIGDLIVDHYIWGNCSRISPEAPVPVVLVEKENTTLGGAANVAENLIIYRSNVAIAGIIGKDEMGRQLLTAMHDKTINTQCVYEDADRPTTQKTRIIAGNHHITRVDKEKSGAIDSKIEEMLFESFKSKMDSFDIVILSDYNKGLFTLNFTQRIIQYCNSLKKKILIDPKGKNYNKYKDAFIIKPNKKELAEAVGVDKIKDKEDLKSAALRLIELTNVQYLVVTLSEEGIALFSIGKEPQYFPVKATEVFDVTGAGDTVIATIAYFLSQGFTIEEACEIANHAAAIVVQHVGSATVTHESLLKHINENRG